jgi:tetratricopeptide (TPR) repeat protein
MTTRTKSGLGAAILLALSFAGSVLAGNRVQTARGREATLEDVLYISSGKTLKRMSLGYSSLMGNIYWTRAVQYFGARVQRSTRFDLLAPLLDITTDLDPHLIPAYENGSIFLSQNIPYGAGRPDQAVALLEKGIRENPDKWHLYFTLGFIQYWDRNDYQAAQDAFERGSQVPGALPYLKIMAARMAEKATDAATAIAMWKAIYDSSTNSDIRDTAVKHISSLRADAQIAELSNRIAVYRQKTGSWPETWADLIRTGLLPGVPLDPTNTAYILEAFGQIEVQDTKQLPFIGEAHGSNQQ